MNEPQPADLNNLTSTYYEAAAHWCARKAIEAPLSERWRWWDRWEAYRRILRMRSWHPKALRAMNQVDSG